MKRLVIILTLALCAPLTHATEKTAAYYMQHVNEAKAKYDNCLNLVAEFASSGNIDEMMKVAEDPECQAADKAIIKSQNNL